MHGADLGRRLSLSARRPGAARGFTLVEVLVAASLGALLMIGVASTAMGLSQTIAQLESETISSIDNVMARIAREVRYAWWVDVPASNRLRIADEQNRITEYYTVGNSLLIRLPDGTEGSVLTGLDAVDFTASTMQRLRERATRAVNGTFYQVGAQATFPTTLVIRPGEALAFGFMVSSDSGPSAAAGVNDQVLDFTPTSFEVAINGYSGGGDLNYALHEARAPGDARSRSSATPLTSGKVLLTAFPALQLAAAAKTWRDYDKKPYRAATEAADIADVAAQVVIAEFLAGTRTASEHSAAIAARDAAAQAAALADLNQSRGGNATEEAFAALAVLEAAIAESIKNGVLLSATPIDTLVNIDMSIASGTPLSAPLRPGVAYTLSLSVTGTFARGLIGGHQVAGGPRMAVSKKISAGADWAAQATIVPISIKGVGRLTTTFGQDVVQQVRIILDPTDGDPHVGSASVYSQVLAEDPWLGVVPGETPSS